MIKKIGSFIGGVASKLRGKALKLAIGALVSVVCLVMGVNLPEPTKQAFVSGSAAFVEAILAAEDERSEGDDAGDD